MFVHRWSNTDAPGVWLYRVGNIGPNENVEPPEFPGSVRPGIILIYYVALRIVLVKDKTTLGYSIENYKLFPYFIYVNILKCYYFRNQMVLGKVGVFCSKIVLYNIKIGMLVKRGNAKM